MSAHGPAAARLSGGTGAEFNPFYCRIPGRTNHPILTRVCFSVALGFLFVVVHFFTTGTAIFKDLSWMVGVLISSAMLFLYYATYTLTDLAAEANTFIAENLHHLYLGPLKFWLSDGKFVFAGIFFGGLNCLMGHFFGVEYSNLSSRISIFSGFFIVGFICGMAAYGLTGVFSFVRGFVRTNPPLDFQDPDRCGGISFIGEGLVKFSVLNLMMGVLISVYIVFAPWANRGHEFVRILMWAWIGWPFFVSLGHVPVSGALVHILLKRYKKQKQHDLSARVRSTRAKIEAPNANTKLWREELEYDLKLQAELYKMKTWPFVPISAVHLVVAFCVDIIPAYLEVVKLFNEGIHPKG